MRAFKIAPPTLANCQLVGHRVLLEQVESISETNIAAGHAFIIRKIGPQVPEEALLKEGMVCYLEPVLGMNKELQVENMMGIHFADQGKRAFVLLTAFTWINFAYETDLIAVQQKDFSRPKIEVVENEIILPVGLKGGKA
jgi:hypothetical protein